MHTHTYLNNVRSDMKDRYLLYREELTKWKTIVF